MVQLHKISDSLVMRRMALRSLAEISSNSSLDGTRLENFAEFLSRRAIASANEFDMDRKVPSITGLFP